MDQARAKRITSELQGRRVGGWKVNDYLGNGASAVVLSAERDGVRAALKLVDPEMVERYGQDSQLMRIERERVLVGHSKDHLVKIYDGGICPETKHLYVVMELIPDPALTALIPRFPRERIGPIIEQLAGAARFLETLQLVHRDIKPDNICIDRDFTSATLLDLGVVLPIGHNEYADAGSGNVFLGTTRYSPPEYIMREEEDTEEGWRAVTFYQLGAVLHDMIMRRKLFDEIDAPPARLSDAVRNARPIVDANDAPPHLVSLARNCLQKDWKLRLKLVRWDHFTTNPPAVRSGDAKARIAHRIAAGPGRSTTTTSNPEMSASSRRQLLHQLGGAVASIIRDVCLQSGMFPPIEVHNMVADVEARISLETGPSEKHALSTNLHVHVLISSLDNQGQVVQLTGTAVLGALGDDVEPAKLTPIYAGDFSAPTLRERLDEFLHFALDAAQNAAGSALTQTINIPPLQ